MGVVLRAVNDAALIASNITNGKLMKIVLGRQPFPHSAGCWQSMIYPNKSHPRNLGGCDGGCEDGCLFELNEDPAETHNLRDEQPLVYAAMLARLHAIGSTVFATDFTDMPVEQCLDAKAAIAHWQGFSGPYCGVFADPFASAAAPVPAAPSPKSMTTAAD